MRKPVLIPVLLSASVLLSGVSVSATTFQNDTLGIHMEIDDHDQLSVIAQNLTNQIADELSWNSFVYNDDEVAAVMVLKDETDRKNNYEANFKKVEEEGEYSYLRTSKNGYIYYLIYRIYEEEGIPSDLAQAIRAAYEQAEYFEPVSIDLSNIDLHATDLDGNEIQNDIFKEKDLTVVNIWATWCNPCLNELPLLAEWEQELPDNVQILYINFITGDSNTETSKELVEALVKRTGISREHVLQYMPGSSTVLDSLTQVFPTTLFVDSSGSFVADPVFGAYVDNYKSVVSSIIKNQ